MTPKELQLTKERDELRKYLTQIMRIMLDVPLVLLDDVPLKPPNNPT